MSKSFVRNILKIEKDMGDIKEILISEKLRCKKKMVVTRDYRKEEEIVFVPLWRWFLERE